MPTKPVNGISMNYAERGRGLPVVLIHGFPLDLRIWDAQVQVLSDRYRIIAPDLRGFGRSGVGGAFSMESLADDVHELLKQIGAIPSVVGGLSMGGYVTMAYARKYPGDLKAVMLIDTRAEADTPEGKEKRNQMLERLKTGGSKAVAEDMFPKMVSEETTKHRQDIAHKLRHIMESQSPETIGHAIAALRDRPDRSSDIRSIGVPTLVMVGEADAITPPALSETMNKAITGSALATIPKAGHMSPMEQPEEANRAIRRFLDGIG